MAHALMGLVHCEFFYRSHSVKVLLRALGLSRDIKIPSNRLFRRHQLASYDGMLLRRAARVDLARPVLRPLSTVPPRAG